MTSTVILSSRKMLPDRVRGCHAPTLAALPGRRLVYSLRFAARPTGLAFGLALAVRPAGLAEVSRVNGAPKARPA